MIYIDNIVSQVNKKRQIVCGDIYMCERTLEGTVFVLCDGLGSGIYANIAATTCSSRLIELIHSGISLKHACETVAESMHRARVEDIPFSAFTVVRILNDGLFNIYSYESPSPVIIENGVASKLATRFYTVSYEVIGEVSGILNKGDSLVLCSDGVTQAGLGRTNVLGWQTDGLISFINKQLEKGHEFKKIANSVIENTKEISSLLENDESLL